MDRFRGLIPPMVTPIDEGVPDPQGIAALVDHSIGHLDGMVVGGSCGEGPSLGRTGRLEVLERFIDAVAGRLPVIAGVASTSLSDIADLIAAGDRIGVAGYLVPPPFYFTNSATGVQSFFGEVAGMTDREIIIYDNPKTTKTTMPVELLASIVDRSANINHVKVTDTDLDKVTDLHEQSDAILLAGSDEVMHHQVLRGCEGAVTAAPQVFPSLCRAWFDAAVAGGGRADYDRLLPLVIELIQGPDQYPAVIKHALFTIGVLASDEVLPPMTPLDDRRRNEVAAVMRSDRTDE